MIGRKHTVEEIKEAYALARKTGFDNINMDIIAGLPGEDISDMEDTLATDRTCIRKSDSAFTGDQKSSQNGDGGIRIGMRKRRMRSFPA